MEYYDVYQCDEHHCPFYHKWYGRYGSEVKEYARCLLLGYDYDHPNQVLVRLWAERRREVERGYHHIRIKDRPDMDDVFPRVPEFCPINEKPVVVMFQKDKWKRKGKSPLFDHYGDSPLGRMKKQLQAEKEQKQKEREQRRIEKERKMKEKEEKKSRKDIK